MSTTTQTDAASRIFAAALGDGMPSALCSFIVGQSGNETNGWTSNFFVNNNNCFGYECSAVSDWQNGCSATNADNGATVGNYDSIEDSTHELTDWIKRRQAENKFPQDLSTITTPEQYATLLSNCGYYTSSSSSYGANIAKWISNLGSSFMSALQGNPVPVVLLIGIAIAGIYVGVKKGIFKNFK